MKYVIALFAFAIFLVIGAAASPVTAQVTNAVYTVQPGDSLYRISVKFNIAPDALARANGIVNPNLIYVGQRLILPGIAATPAPGATQIMIGAVSPTAISADATLSATVSATMNATATMSATSAAPGVSLTPYVPPTPISAPTTYTVQTGDNLYRISLKFNTTPFILSQLNGLSNTNLVYVGQVLRLPVVSAPSPVNAVPTAVNPTPIIPAASVGTSVAITSVAATAAPLSVTVTPGNSVSQAAPASTSGNVGFGIGLVIDQAQDSAGIVKATTDLNATWVKQIADWRTIEKTQGSPDYAALDTAVNAYNAANLKVLLTVVNAPDWARATTQEDGPPTDSNTFATFSSALATHFKGKVQAYEIWNEPNLRRNWNGKPLSAASYVELLRLAYSAIKSVDSSALVISAGLSPTGFNDGVNAIDDRAYLRQEYTSGLASYADAVGAHPNGWANPPDSTCCQASPGVTGWFNARSFYFRDTLNDYRQIMKDSNDSGKFMWVTAFGWGANEGVAADNTVNDTNFGFVKFTSQAKQAQYLVRGFEIGRDLAFVGPMFVDNLNACQAVAAGGSSDSFYPCYYSLLDANGAPRPAYDAIKALHK